MAWFLFSCVAQFTDEGNKEDIKIPANAIPKRLQFTSVLIGIK